MDKKVTLSTKANAVGRTAVVPSKSKTFLDAMGAFGEALQTGTQVLQAENEEQFKRGLEQAAAGYSEENLPRNSKAYARGYMEYMGKADAAKFEDVANTVMKMYPDRPQDWEQLFKTALSNNYSDLIITTTARQGSKTYMKHFNNAKSSILSNLSSKAREAILNKTHEDNINNRTVALTKSIFDLAEGNSSTEDVEKQIKDIKGLLGDKTDDMIMNLISNASADADKLEPFMDIKNAEGFRYSELFAGRFKSMAKSLQATEQEDKFKRNKETEELSSLALDFLDENPNASLSSIGSFIVDKASELNLLLADKGSIIDTVKGIKIANMQLSTAEAKVSEADRNKNISKGFELYNKLVSKIRNGYIDTPQKLQDELDKFSGDDFRSISSAVGKDIKFQDILKNEREQKVYRTINNLTEISTNSPEFITIIKQAGYNVSGITAEGRNFVNEFKNGLKATLNNIADGYIYYGDTLKEGETLRSILKEEAKAYTLNYKNTLDAPATTQNTQMGTKEFQKDDRNFLQRISDALKGK